MGEDRRGLLKRDFGRRLDGKGLTWLVTLLWLGTIVAGGCGGAAGGSAEDGNKAESGLRPGLAKPVAIRAGGRVFERAEPELEVLSERPPKELVVETLIPGAGPQSGDGDDLTVEYVGIYYDGSFFTNSWERSVPFVFELGSRGQSPGWERGLKGMRIGERRKLILPPRYQVWDTPLPKGVDEAVVYVVDLLRID